MKKEEHIVSYTAEELDEKIARGESQTDWQRVRCMTDEDIERNADEDPDSPAYPYPDDFWQDAELVSPQKQGNNIVKLDDDVAEIFPDEKSVNDALRALAKIIRSHQSSA